MKGFVVLNTIDVQGYLKSGITLPDNQNEACCHYRVCDDTGQTFCCLSLRICDGT